MKNYFELVKALLENQGSAALCYKATEELLRQDAFNPSLIFANGLSALLLNQMNANFIQGMKADKGWMPPEFAAELIPQLEAIVAQHEAQHGSSIRTLREPEIAGSGIVEMDYSRNLSDYSPAELIALSSSDIEEYSRYRDLFDRNPDHPAFHGFPENFSDKPVGQDLKIEFSAENRPLVLFFQGFFSAHCPSNLRIPSFRIPFSQAGICNRLDPERKKFSRIFVRDHFQVWYQAGLHGRGSPLTLASQLKSAILSIRPSRIVTFGVSAGGFASLLFGHLLDADRILAFSPQTLVFEETPGSYLNEYRNLFRERFLDGRPYVLKDIAKLEFRKGRARLFFADRCEGDEYHAMRLEKKMELVPKPSATHGGYLDKQLAGEALLAAIE